MIYLIRRLPWLLLTIICPARALAAQHGTVSVTIEGVSGPPADMVRVVPQIAGEGKAKSSPERVKRLRDTIDPATGVATHHKSPATALLLSVGITVLPILSRNPAITAVGLGLGPSVGLFYAGAPGRGLLGIGIRSAVAAVAGISVIVQCDGVEDDVCGIAPILIGGSAIAASAIWDIVTAPHAAQRWNQRHAMPVLMPVRGGVGLGMAVEF